VDAVYQGLHRERANHPLEQEAFEHQDYDQVLTNLERAIDNKKLVREKVAEALELSENADTLTHKALLTLATDADGACRLVTTNYDLCFSCHKNPSTPIHAAPRMPVPKPGRWNSIVHLHGFLEDEYCGPDKEELVLSSADFGAAYLVDGWATRFLRELFQHFTVLFVGYSAEDLVIRYMLQALAVSLGGTGNGPKAFAFAEIRDDEKATRSRWQAKGIEPILYANEDDHHEILHNTLRTWADRASHGLLGRRSVLDDYIDYQPPVPPEVVDQLRWALKDENGATAEYLADQNPSPSPRHWLALFDRAKLFSLNDAPLVDDGRSALCPAPLHEATWNLARWLCRHLNEPEVLDWVLVKGGYLNPSFCPLVQQALSESSHTISDEIRRAWTYLSRDSHLAASRWRGDSYELRKQIASGEWDLHIKSEVVGMLEPAPVLKRDVIQDIFREAGQVESGSYPLDIQINLAGGNDAPSLLDAIRSHPDCDSILASLLDDCTSCLRRSLSQTPLKVLGGGYGHSTTPPPVGRQTSVH